MGMDTKPGRYIARARALLDREFVPGFQPSHSLLASFGTVIDYGTSTHRLTSVGSWSRTCIHSGTHWLAHRLFHPLCCGECELGRADIHMLPGKPAACSAQEPAPTE
ncbi:hypothetical protein ONS95_007926 [Cadophora gregata]|uniref:uncharacterized protein n=1 Tax=Cadophora gregata TaxID=51156 RepID=UPI0026DCDC40|nr:uncharacterized protein ONS95_007926 [Cadophora gregata]KAK0126317.1 hypothetical protein ONS95_007926 [Cadophora gregata]